MTSDVPTPRNGKLKSQVNMTFWFWLMYPQTPPLLRIWKVEGSYSKLKFHFKNPEMYKFHCFQDHYIPLQIWVYLECLNLAIPNLYQSFCTKKVWIHSECGFLAILNLYQSLWKKMVRKNKEQPFLALPNLYQSIWEKLLEKKLECPFLAVPNLY